MTRAEFEALVVRALEGIPDEIGSRLDNVDVVVEDVPSRDQLAGNEIGEGELLLGLYEGIPLTERYGYGEVLPDKISIYQETIESICATDQEVRLQVHKTVHHEIAHYFGIDDDRLHELGMG